MERSDFVSSKLTTCQLSSVLFGSEALVYQVAFSVDFVFLTAPAVVSAGGEGERSETELTAETTAEG